MVEQIVEPAAHVMRRNVRADAAAIAHAVFGVAMLLQPLEIIVLPRKARAARDRQRREQPRAAVGHRPRIVIPVQTFQELVQLFGIQILLHLGQLVAWQRVKQLQRGDAVRRGVERMMRRLGEQSRIRRLHVLHRLHPFRALGRVAHRRAHGVQQVGRVGAAVFVHAHVAPRLGNRPSRVRAGGQLVALHSFQHLDNDRINVHAVFPPLFLKWTRNPRRFQKAIRIHDAPGQIVLHPMPVKADAHAQTRVAHHALLLR